MALTKKDVEAIFESLRGGTVPEGGLEAFAVGIEKPRGEIDRLLSLAASGRGVSKFLRGGYGCGKTFMARLAVLDAQKRNFATSFVVVSDNDLHFHKFDELYRKVVQQLATSSCPRGALGDIIDRWIARVEEAVIAGGVSEDAPELDERVQERMKADIASKTGGKAPPDLGRVLTEIFALKQQGKTQEAGALIAWLSGSPNVAASVKKSAGIKGEISGSDAMDYLQGILEIVKAAGYEGLVIVIDEAETILRMRQDVRGKSLNGIRQIIDAAERYQKLFWIFTGTPEFFDTRRGVAGLQPLHDRIQFNEQGGFVSLRQPQLELKPFDEARLKEVALKLREIYPAHDEEARTRLEVKVDRTFIDRLVGDVSTGLKANVGVVPRQFMRQLVTVMDLVDQEPEYEPSKQFKFEPKEPLDPREQGRREYAEEAEDARGYAETTVEF